MGLSIPQYFNEYTAIKGYGPVHTGARWVNVYAFFSLLIIFLKQGLVLSREETHDIASSGSSMT